MGGGVLEIDCEQETEQERERGNHEGSTFLYSGECHLRVRREVPGRCKWHNRARFRERTRRRGG